MYFTYDTEGFEESDYEKIAALRGFSARMSTARGENYRGRIISADRLIYATQEAALAALPEGYAVTESIFASSDGKLVKCLVQNEPAGTGHAAEEHTVPDSQSVDDDTVSRYPNESAAADAVKRTIAARGAQAGLNLLASLTVIGVLTKAVPVLTCMEEILSSAKTTDYADCNILDIFQAVPKLRVAYWDNEEKRDQLQEQFDRLIEGTLTLTDIKNPFDKIYLKGLCELLHIELQ